MRFLLKLALWLIVLWIGLEIVGAIVFSAGIPSDQAARSAAAGAAMGEWIRANWLPIVALAAVYVLLRLTRRPKTPSPGSVPSQRG